MGFLQEPCVVNIYAAPPPGCGERGWGSGSPASEKTGEGPSPSLPGMGSVTGGPRAQHSTWHPWDSTEYMLSVK